MQFIDLAEQTRLLGQVAPTLESLRADVERVRAGEVSKPVRELAPITIRAQELAMRCTQQLAVLSTSQYAAMKDGHENLAELAEVSAQVSLAAAMSPSPSITAPKCCSARTPTRPRRRADTS